MSAHFKTMRGETRSGAGSGISGSAIAASAKSANSRWTWWIAFLTMARALKTARTGSYIRSVSAIAALWLLAALSTNSAFGQGASIYGQVVDSTGRPVTFGLVRVCAYTGGGLPCSPLSSLFSDIQLTVPVPNPYTTDQVGNYSFFVTPTVSPGTAYILQITVAPGQVYSYLVTAGGGGGSGSGTLTNFASGNFSPLFSTSVSNPTTTPLLSFTALTVPNFTFFGNFSGGTLVPKFWTLAPGANVTLTPSGGNMLTIAATGGGSSTCGPVEGDATSTDCGTGNLVSSTGTERSTYGDGNANTAATTDLIGIGDATTAHVSGTDIIGIGDTASQYITGNDFIGIGDEALFGDATRLRTGHDVVAIGNEAVSVGSSPGTTNLVSVVGIGESAGLDVSGTDLYFMGSQSGAHSSGNEVIGIGTTAASNVSGGTSIVGVGDAAASDQGAGNSDVVGVGDGTSARIGAGSADITGVGDGAAANLAAGSSDVVGIGDGAGAQPSGTGTSVANVVAVGDGAGGSNNGNEFIGIGTQAGECNNANNTIALGALAVGGGLFSTNCNSAQVTGDENIGIGDHADTANTSGTDNVAVGDSSGADGYVNSGSVGHSNVTGSHNTWLGAKTGPNTATQLSNTIGLGYQAFNTQSNQTVIGNSSITQLIIFGSGDGCLSSSSGIVTGSGVACGSGGGGGSAFSAITGSTNTTATMVVGTGASLSTAGSGTIAATSVGGIVVTGTPGIGNVLTATSTSAANWQAPSGGSSAFSAITGSTNTTAAMICGTGCSITTSGSGVNTATKLSTAGTTATVLHGNAAGNPTYGAVVLTTDVSGLLPHANIANTAVTPGSYTNANITVAADGSITAAANGSGGSSGISGLTAGFLPLAGSATTITANSPCDYAITTALTITCTAPVAVTGTDNGSIDFVATGSTLGSVPTSTVRLAAPNAVTAYEMDLPAGQPSGASQFITCTNANPSICSFAAVSAGTATLVASQESVSFSATPTFSISFRESTITLTGAITSFTLGAGAAGQEKTLTFCQDATGGRNVTPPANVHGFMNLSGGTETASTCASQHFSYNSIQTAWLADSPGVVNQ